MKVTALLPDELVMDVRVISGGKNITESLIIALSDWTAQQKVRQLNAKVKRYPFQFQSGYSADTIRNLNRKQ